MAPIAYFFLPDSPDKARYLNEEEKLVAKARGVRQVGTAARIGGIVWKDVGAALIDPKCWFTAVSIPADLANLRLTNCRPAHVLQLQCQLLLPSRLSSSNILPLFPPWISLQLIITDNSHRHGLLRHQRARPDRSSILHLFPCHHRLYLCSGPPPTARLHADVPVHRRRHRLHPSRNLLLSRCPLLWRLPRRFRCISLHRQHSPLGLK